MTTPVPSSMVPPGADPSGVVRSPSSVAQASRLFGPCVGRTRVPVALILASAAAVLASLGFALAPLDRPAPPRVDLSAPASAAPARLAALDLDAFRAPIWVAEPPPPPPPAPPPPAALPPPLRLQLLAIVRDAGTLRATLYDPDTDRLHVVAAGDTVGTRAVERVEPDAVHLRDEAGPRTLSLRDPPREMGGSR